MLSLTQEGFIADGPVLFQIPVRCAYFNSSDSHQCWVYKIAGEVLNLETHHYFGKGAYIMIRLEKFLPSPFDDIEKKTLLRHTSLAKVISCQKISSEGVTRYSIVAQYCDRFRS